ncbi:hypothetical protein CEXT_484891, partial [Caerostris extrusa]
SLEECLQEPNSNNSPNSSFVGIKEFQDPQIHQFTGEEVEYELKAIEQSSYKPHGQRSYNTNYDKENTVSSHFDSDQALTSSNDGWNSFSVANSVSQECDSFESLSIKTPEFISISQEIENIIDILNENKKNWKSIMKKERNFGKYSTYILHHPNTPHTSSTTPNTPHKSSTTPNTPHCYSSSSVPMQLSISNYDILPLENDLRCLSTKKADKSRSPKSNYPKIYTKWDSEARIALLTSTSFFAENSYSRQG